MEFKPFVRKRDFLSPRDEVEVKSLYQGLVRDEDDEVVWVGPFRRGLEEAQADSERGEVEVRKYYTEVVKHLFFS